MLRAFFLCRGDWVAAGRPEDLSAGRKEGLPNQPHLLDSPLTMDAAVGGGEGD